MLGRPWRMLTLAQLEQAIRDRRQEHADLVAQLRAERLLLVELTCERLHRLPPFNLLPSKVS